MTLQFSVPDTYMSVEERLEAVEVELAERVKVEERLATIEEMLDEIGDALVYLSTRLPR